MKNQIPFYQLFYGFEFHRHFTRPLDFKSQIKYQIQFTVNDAKQLYIHVHRNSGFHPCYTSIYDYGSKDNLKHKESEKMVIDRAFFDFDIHHEQAHKLKKELMTLRSRGLHHQKSLQDELKVQLQNLVIDERITEPAINEAKDFTIEFKESFGTYPLLFFSGLKGCHAYTFFEPVNVDVKRVLLRFAEDIKKTFHYNTLDLSVYGSLNSRVTYTKHQYTDLTVVPFTIDDSYDTIIEKSLKPVVKPFSREAYHSSLGELLQKNDPILHKIELRKKEERMKAARATNKPFNSIVNDHRLFFKSILGEPIKEYPDKEYVMYKCPFKGHDDNKPSFRVYKTGYQCYGCGKKGNYFQFLKDYNNWSNEQVKAHIRSINKKEIVGVVD